jgi:acyl-CoA thioester hydrolase
MVMATHSSRVRVRYAETDQMGVAYYANYFVWFEVGRCELLRWLGLTYRDLEANGILLPVIEAHCTFRDSARYDDDLEIATTGSLVSPVRVQFWYNVSRRADSTPLATGRTVHAAVDAAGQPCRLPTEVQAILK